MAKKRYLVIMAGGASSRMKKSLAEVDLDKNIRHLAEHQHKCLVPVGEKQRPLLYYQLRIASQVAVDEVFIITPVEQHGFISFLSEGAVKQEFKNLNIHLLRQVVPAGADKPLGTADAILQAIDQREELRQSSFVVHNGDNIYSAAALAALFSLPSSQQALIGYNREGLQFASERIQKFAVVQSDVDHYVQQIIEKPTPAQVAQSKGSAAHVYVSMNIFKLNGPALRPYLGGCPIHPIRKEKELPRAIQAYISDYPKSFQMIPREEHVPDLTSAHDLNSFH